MFTLNSPAFKDGSVIPDKYVEDRLVSPPLKWENPPAGTECYALVMLDQDIPLKFRKNLGRGFIHWMAMIPADAFELAEGASPDNMPSGSVEFKTDFVNLAIPGYGNHYGGPWPPDTRHRYSFLLFALKSTPKLLPDSEAAEIGNAILFNTIDVARLMGVYGPSEKPL